MFSVRVLLAGSLACLLLIGCTGRVDTKATLPAPTFNPAAGTYSSSQSVGISDATAGTTIYYTTDGTTPTASSTAYSGPITVSSSKTLQAIAAATGYKQQSNGCGRLCHWVGTARTARSHIQSSGRRLQQLAVGDHQRCYGGDDYLLHNERIDTDCLVNCVQRSDYRQFQRDIGSHRNKDGLYQQPSGHCRLYHWSRHGRAMHEPCLVNQRCRRHRQN